MSTSKKHIALIGGSGFIGSVLAGNFNEQSLAYSILDKAHTTPTDIRNYTELKNTLEGSTVIYNLAAEHRDDVEPRSLYYEVNVKGSENVCTAAEELGIDTIIFTSSVAVYGFAKEETDETGEFHPFNDYGKTKLEAEKAYIDWFNRDSEKRKLVIVRPTVVFGEGNRGNVYNLLKQMASGLFIMVGNGKNRKSMAYVENVAAFLAYSLTLPRGLYIFNYVDKPDYDMNALVDLVRKTLGKPSGGNFRMPYWLGYLGGLLFDGMAKITGKKYPISAIRVKKFCSNTRFSSSTIAKTGFTPPYSLDEGLKNMIKSEFL